MRRREHFIGAVCALDWRTDGYERRVPVDVYRLFLLHAACVTDWLRVRRLRLFEERTDRVSVARDNSLFRRAVVRCLDVDVLLRMVVIETEAIRDVAEYETEHTKSAVRPLPGWPIADDGDTQQTPPVFRMRR